MTLDDLLKSSGTLLLFMYERKMAYCSPLIDTVADTSHGMSCLPILQLMCNQA
jgi:hypothetical protein